MRLFISYAHVDKAIVKDWVVSKLVAGGHDVWFDDRLVAGQDWKQQLSGEIERSDALVYCMTPESVASDWCLWELTRAVDLGKPVISVLMQARTHLPDQLKKLQYVDFSDGPTGNAVARLMGGLHNLSPAQIPSTPADSNGKPAHAIEQGENAEQNVIMKILRDPLWQFVGVVIGVVAIVIGIVTSGGSGNSTQSAAQPTPSTPRIIAQQNIDIRNGPGTNFDRIAVLNVGDHLDILGISEDDRWYQVLLADGNTGWVVVASSTGEVSGPLGALAVIVPTNTPTATPTQTPTATDAPTATPTVTDTSEPSDTPTLTATETQAPTATPTQTDSPTSTTAPSDTPQPPTDTAAVDSTHTEAPETAIATPDVVASASQFGECPSQFGAEMVFVPATSFRMGSPEGVGEDDERPQREVMLDAFCMDVYEVTNGSYRTCVEAGVCSPPQRNSSRLVRQYYSSTDYDQFPIVNVTWDQAQTFCEYRGGRLPTEAEWEFAARLDLGTSQLRAYAWGDEPPLLSRANFAGVGIGDVVAVGQYPAGRNSLGIFDLNGNAAEWMADFYSFYDLGQVYNPTGTDSGSERVVRGGSYINNAEDIRSAARDSEPQTAYSDRIGFRCVANAS
ncbi:MAG: SUMF1/EgtB/PvdO family nonheme iron enzyme [Chloroflexi bacterium]|jgi:formylglycine-generating enzyme required for sulfatase activity|nr:SUMF1/EgtB/PvdO family nonheme iron enzyme [Chloroflexota bacterium]